MNFVRCTGGTEKCAEDKVFVNQLRVARKINEQENVAEVATGGKRVEYIHSKLYEIATRAGKAIVEIQGKYMDIISVNNTRISIEYLNELKISK